jgi:hypothetical protein
MPDNLIPSNQPKVVASANGNGIDIITTVTIPKELLLEQLANLQRQAKSLQRQIDDITAKLALIENK